MNITKMLKKHGMKIIIICLIIAIIFIIQKNKEGYIIPKKRGMIRKNKWRNKGLGKIDGVNYGKMNPYDRLKELIKVWGQPDHIDNRRNGYAIWGENTLKSIDKIWDMSIIIDELIPHKKPGPHTDFLYTWYSLVVPDDKINDVRAISDSITYDPLKKQIMTRCHFLGANAATALLAKRVAAGEMTLEEAKKNYGPYIMATMGKNKKRVYKDYIKELRDYKENAVKSGEFKFRRN